MTTLFFNGQEVKPGERKTIELPVARLYTQTDVVLPIHVVRGRSPGPTLFVSGAIHGDELNGVEIIRRMLSRKALSRIRGTLIAVPIVNVYGFLQQSRYLPDRRDLNRSFPGSEAGSLAGRLADLFMTEIADQCTHGIDFHTGSDHRENLAQIRACLDDTETRRLALAFGAPVVLDTNLRDGSLRQSVHEKGKPMLLYEAGEALRFSEVGVRVGVKGAFNVMRAISMLPPLKKQSTKVTPAVARQSVWLRAPISGMLETNARLGDMVKRGDRIGAVFHPLGEDRADVIARVSGIVIGRRRNPMVYRGDAVYHIATFDKSASIEESLEAFHDEYEDYP